MSFDKKFTYSSSSSSEIHIDISNEFYNHYEFKDLVKFQSGFFKKNHGLLNNVSQDMWYMCQKFYSPSTYFPKPGLLHRNGPKTYEILMEFDLVSYSNGTLNSLHLDEEYGAVVGAINHYLHSNVKEVEWNWMATRINPYYEDDPTNSLVDYKAVDDSLVNFYYGKFNFGRDYTGNFCDPQNIKHLENNCSEDVSLITADASFSTFKVEVKPQQDENLFYDRLYAELTAGLRILRDGGNFVWKVFTMFNENSVCLVYLLNLVFEKVQLYKPFASPSCNFEVYVVCQKFKKDTENLDILLDKMLENIGKNNPIFPKGFIPSMFLKEHLEFMDSLEKTQNYHIELFLKLGDNSTSRESEKQIAKVKEAVSEFLCKYKITPIRKRLTSNTRNAFSCIKAHGFLLPFKLPLPKVVAFGQMNNKDRKKLLSKTLSELSKHITFPKKEVLPKISYWKIEVISGKPIEKVTKSMFVAPDFLYKMVLVIEKAYGKSLLKLSLFKVSCQLLDTKITYKFENNFGYSEREFLRKVLNNFIENKPQDIQFEKFYFVTHFSVSVLALIAQFYTKCSMNSVGNIHLQHFVPDHSKWKQVLKLKKIEDFTSIVSLMRPTTIQRTDFAIKIVEFNSFLLITHMKRFVDSIG